MSSNTSAPVLDKDKTAVELYGLIAESYPMNTIEGVYLRDTKYIILLLLKHLRYTFLDIRTLQRNIDFFKLYVRKIQYQSRNQWLRAMKRALIFFFPI